MERRSPREHTRRERLGRWICGIGLAALAAVAIPTGFELAAAKLEGQITTVDPTVDVGHDQGAINSDLSDRMAYEAMPEFFENNPWVIPGAGAGVVFIAAGLGIGRTGRPQPPEADATSAAEAPVAA